MEKSTGNDKPVKAKCGRCFIEIVGDPERDYWVAQHKILINPHTRWWCWGDRVMPHSPTAKTLAEGGDPLGRKWYS